LSGRHGGKARLLSLLLPLALLDADVVQFEWNMAAVDHLPLFDVWRCAVLVSCRGSDLLVYPHVPTLAAYSERLTRVLHRADLVHCVSASLREEAIRLGMDARKARVIKPAVDPELFCPPPRAPQQPERTAGTLSVIWIGGHLWEKGHEYGLQAIRALLDDRVPVRLTLIGATAAPESHPVGEQRRIAHTVADLRLEAHVLLLPRVDPIEVRDRLRRADVLMHPSLSEGISNAVLEAMACALPVVTTSAGGMREAVRDGVEGFVVAPRQPGELAAALTTLWRDPARRQEMGAAGRRRVIDGFDLRAQTEAFLAMYREAVA